MGRWLHFVGLALLFVSALGFLPGVRQVGSLEFPRLIVSACAALAGGVTLIASRRRSSPEVLLAFLWTTFAAIAGMMVAEHLAYAGFALRWNSAMLFGTTSGSLFGFGAPVVWGSALARLDDAAGVQAQKAGRISAGAVQLGFVFLFASEVRQWGMMSSGMGMTGGAASAFAASQAFQLVDRVLLLWATVESVRTAADEETIRRRASRIHRLMAWWVVLSLVTDVGGTLLIQRSPYAAPSGTLLHAFWRILVPKGLAVAAALAVSLHLRSKRVGYKSGASDNPWSGAEA